MKAIKLAILWHQHQPEYRMNGEFILPWVRFHGIKDYFDLAELLHQFPDIKQTFNLVPSLINQIEVYISGKAQDKIQRLTRIPADKLSINERQIILNDFFICNLDNMIFPYPRYKYLYEKSKSNTAVDFTIQEMLDLQVWYNLTWFGGISRQDGFVKRLFAKAQNFSEAEKLQLLDYQIYVLSKIIPQLRLLEKIGQIEISVSPLNHPILPLIIDSESALESTPNLKMLELKFSFPKDAYNQIALAKEFYFERFHQEVSGFWPSEGSLSNKTLELFSSNNVKWLASDEQILQKSLGNDFVPTYKFFPHKYVCNFEGQHGEIVIFFRDHFLSDRIGFAYSNWNAEDAANDFLGHLHSIRNEIIKVHGEDALDFACISVILDGENCWEFYQDNGIHFLKALYSRLEKDELVETVKFSDAKDNIYPNLKVLDNIKAGSWINANFNIWIGDEEDRKAWEMLGTARREVEQMKTVLSHAQYLEALNLCYIAESSDWFWWYGDDHRAPNDKDFDVLFRYYIDQIYRAIGKDTPHDVFVPIMKSRDNSVIKIPQNNIKPKIDGKILMPDEWFNAGLINLKHLMSSMHQIGEFVERFYFGQDDKSMFFRIDTSHLMAMDEEIFLVFPEINIELHISANLVNLKNEENKYIHNFQFAIEEVIEISIDKGLFYIPDNNQIQLKFYLISKQNISQIRYPANGEFLIIL